MCVYVRVCVCACVYVRVWFHARSEFICTWFVLNNTLLWCRFLCDPIHPINDLFSARARSNALAIIIGKTREIIEVLCRGSEGCCCCVVLMDMIAIFVSVTDTVTQSHTDSVTYCASHVNNFAAFSENVYSDNWHASSAFSADELLGSISLAEATTIHAEALLIGGTNLICKLSPQLCVHVFQSAETA